MSYLKKTYDYVDEQSSLLFQVCRFEPKDFRQRRPDPEKPGGWLWGVEGVRRVLFRLPQVLKERHLILLVEGEKDVLAAEKLGFVSTTAPMGAGKWRPEYTEALTGVETVVILPDHDEPGRQDAAQKAAALFGQAQHVKIVTLPALPEKGDLSDWVALSKDKRSLPQQLLTLMHETPDYQPPQDVLSSHGKPLDRSIACVLDKLTDVKQTSGGFQAHCPAHDDRKASLSITEKDGKILLYCHAGCKTDAVVTAMGLEMTDLFLDDRANRQAAAPDVQFVQFWYEVTVNEGKETERIETRIDYGLFLEFLQQNGFGLLCQDDQVRIVRRINNIVSNTVEVRNLNLTIKQFVLSYLARIKQKVVREILLRQHGTFFSTAFLTALKPIDIAFYRDTRHACTLFFQNGFVEVRRNGDGVKVEFKSYADLTECIWESYVQPRTYCGVYHPTTLADDQQPSVFQRFFSLISTEFTGRDDSYEPGVSNLKAFQYTFGYLVHHDKDPANARAVVCVDNNAERGDANGRRGKSLFCEALKKLRKVSVEDGRTLKTDDNQFLFQTLDLDSQVLLVDDVKPNFDFAVFYNAISGDLALEKKRGQRLMMGFLNSPKIVMTTNYAMLGNGDSHIGRWYVLPFTNYFSAAYTPLHEFQQRFFVDWDDAEWHRFDDFAIACLTVYFEAAEPILANLHTYQESKLKAAIPAELLDYLETYLHALPYEVPKKTFFADFKALYPIYEKSTQNWFSTKVSTYCKLRGVSLNAGAKDGRCWKTETDGAREEYFVFTKEEPAA